MYLLKTSSSKLCNSSYLTRKVQEIEYNFIKTKRTFSSCSLLPKQLQNNCDDDDDDDDWDDDDNDDYDSKKIPNKKH